MFKWCVINQWKGKRKNEREGTTSPENRLIHTSHVDDDWSHRIPSHFSPNTSLLSFLYFSYKIQENHSFVLCLSGGKMAFWPIKCQKEGKTVSTDHTAVYSNKDYIISADVLMTFSFRAPTLWQLLFNDVFPEESPAILFMFHFCSSGTFRECLRLRSKLLKKWISFIASGGSVFYFSFFLTFLTVFLINLLPSERRTVLAGRERKIKK